MLVNGFNHVEDGQRGRGNRGQRLHLNTGHTASLDGRLDTHKVGSALEIHRNLAQGQRVAERNDLGSALGAHNARNARHRQSIALGQVGVKNLLDDVRAGVDGCLSHRGAGGYGFFRHIDHVRRAVGAHMGEILFGGRGHRVSWNL